MQLISKGQPNPLKNILHENETIFIVEKVVSSAWALWLILNSQVWFLRDNLKCTHVHVSVLVWILTSFSNK